MSLAKDMATLLQTQGVGTVGTDIFYGTMPDTDLHPDAAWAVIETGATFVNSKYKRDELTFQVLIRGPRQDYDTGYTNAKTAFDALLGIANQTVNGTDYLQFNTDSGIINLGNDARDRARFSINFRVVRENVSGGARSTF